MKGLKIGKKKNMLMIWIVVGVVLIVGILAIVSQLAPKKEVLPSVEVVSVTKGDVSEKLDASGNVKSMNSKTFFAPVNAKIQNLNFEAGDIVKAGDQMIDFELKDLEKDNQKAELNVLSGKYDYSETVNQSNKADAKVANAQSKAGSLQAQVNDWQAYVDALQAQINQETADAQAQGAAAAEAATAQQNVLVAQAKDAYDICADTEVDSHKKYLAAETALAIAGTGATQKLYDDKNAAQIAWDTAKRELEQAETKYYDLLSGGSSYDASSLATADTAWLQQELQSASTELAKLEGDLASQKAIAEGDGGALTSDTLAKMNISTNLLELEAKSLEELIAEGEKGIQAEFTGVISDSKVINGAPVTQGMEMFTLQSTEDVSVEVKISRYDYDKLKEGQKAVITLANTKYDGTVTKIDRIAIPNEKGTPMIGATVHIDKPDENIFIGVEASVTIQAAEANNVPIVPVEVVNIGNEGSFCYVIEDDVIVKRDVETGVTSASYVEIKSGLKEGDQVITDIGEHVEGDSVKGMEGTTDATDEKGTTGETTVVVN